MDAEQITITVDAAAAKTYRSATPTERRSLDMLLTASLHNAKDPRSLGQIMQEIGEEAERRGMTPDILSELLKDI